MTTMTTIPAPTAPPAPAHSPDGVLSVVAAGLRFQNPVVLASGTAGFARELAGVIDLDRIGGLATKAVSPRPRQGNPAPRVAEFSGGMINAVGLANPGVEAVRADHLPWIGEHLRRTRVLVNVVGDSVEDYATVVARLDDAPGVDGFELNVSCPNVKAGGMEFGASRETLRELVAQARAATRRPLFVKLSPMLPDVAATAAAAVEAGADGLTLVNTIPGLVIDVERRRPALGFGTGGVSGKGLLPVGVRAVWLVRRALGPAVPLIGVGGVSSASDALQYLLAGASLVGIGTAAMQNPRVPERVVRDLERWCRRRGVRSIADVVGSIEWGTR